MSSRGGKKGGGDLGPTPWESESAGRTASTHPETGMGLVTTDFEPIPYDYRTGEQYSSYPHLTPQVGDRPEHVTSSRSLGPIEDPSEQRRLNLYVRTHQDNVRGAPLQVDRFFAADRDSGEVFPATVKLNPDVHQKKGAMPPTRGDTVSSIDMSKLRVDVGSHVDEKHPPLSPRSRLR